MRPSIGMTALLVGALAVAAAGRAQSPPAAGASDGDAVPLYTNADLAKFGPPTGPNVPVLSDLPADWDFVEAFLEREYSRIDADRENALVRARTDRLNRPVRPHYVAPYLGVYGYPGILPFRYPSPWTWPTPPGRAPQGSRPSAPGPGMGRDHSPSAHLTPAPRPQGHHGAEAPGRTAR